VPEPKKFNNHRVFDVDLQLIIDGETDTKLSYKIELYVKREGETAANTAPTAASSADYGIKKSEKLYPEKGFEYYNRMFITYPWKDGDVWFNYNQALDRC